MPPPPRLTGLPPVAGPGPRVLVLGSFPSRLSLERSEYFANPWNRFWTLVELLFGIRSDLPYRERIRLLGKRGIALWDVVGSCLREGSSDAAIREPMANDIQGFVKDHPSIHLIVLNGGTAGSLFHRSFRGRIPPKVRIITLPSTSPANARFTLPELVGKWRVVLDFTGE